MVTVVETRPGALILPSTFSLNLYNLGVDRCLNPSIHILTSFHHFRISLGACSFMLMLTVIVVHFILQCMPDFHVITNQQEECLFWASILLHRFTVPWWGEGTALTTVCFALVGTNRHSFFVSNQSHSLISVLISQFGFMHVMLYWSILGDPDLIWTTDPETEGLVSLLNSESSEHVTKEQISFIRPSPSSSTLEMFLLLVIHDSV